MILPSSCLSRAGLRAVTLTMGRFAFMAGLDDPSVVDLVTQGRDGEVALIISHGEVWNPDGTDAPKLREKLNNYAFFALDEGLVANYPETAGQPIRFQIDCVDEPSGLILEVVDAARHALEQYDIRLVINLIRPGA